MRLHFLQLGSGRSCAMEEVMKIVDPASTLDGKGVTVELLPLGAPVAPARPRWWRHPIRAWKVRDLPDAITPRFRLRVLDASGALILDADDYQLYLTLLFSGGAQP